MSYEARAVVCAVALFAATWFLFPLLVRVLA